MKPGDTKPYNLHFAAASDETRIKELLKDCGLPWEDITVHHLRNFFVLKDEKGLIGIIGMEVFDRVALLRSLAVRTQDRNRGFASELMKRTEEYAQSIGVHALYLLTMTAADFLARRGYQRLNRSLAPALLRETEEFRSLCPASAVCMVKYLKDGENNRQ